MQALFGKTFDLLATMLDFRSAVGLFQSIVWMANRKAMVIGFNRRRVDECIDCNAACDNICPMRIKPRKIKRMCPPASSAASAPTPVRKCRQAIQRGRCSSG